MSKLQLIKLVDGPDHLPTEAHIENPHESAPYFIPNGPNRRHRYHWSGRDQEGTPVYTYMAEDYSTLGYS